MADRINPTNWNEEDSYWRDNYRTRPYAGSNDYSYYQPGYRYGFEAANRYQGREWNDVEADLRRDWEKYDYRGQSAWENIKAAARAAWVRVTGHRTVSTR
jgi:hypothetical protein